MEQSPTALKRSLSLTDGILIVAGSMIGSGIFIVSSDMVRNVGSAGWLMLIWLITGIMTVFAAISYGELSSMFPKAGGQYVFLKEAYNPLTGFLYGWSFFTVIQTGTIAAVGVAFSKFAGYFIPALEMKDANILFSIGDSFKLYPAQLVSIALIIFLTWVNSRGVKEGKLIQRVFTNAKLLSLFGLIIFGFLLAAKADIWNANWATGFQLSHTTPINGNADNGWHLFNSSITLTAGLGLVASAMVGSVFSSVAWENVTFIAGEIKNPQRNVGLSLFLGTLLVTIIYITINLMYVAVLPLTPATTGDLYQATQLSPSIAFAPQDRVATAASFSIFGNIGALVIAVMIMISTFGCNNGLIMTGARVFYTMALDNLFFKKAAQLNKNAVPGWALWAQCVWTSILCLSGKYGLLLDYVVFVTLIFYIITIYGIFRLRKSRPDAERPYKAFGYPLIPIIYFILAGAMAIGLLIAKWETCVFGIIVVLIGLPVYYLFVRKEKQPTI
ncbi:amino acid transporter [Taibaiella sp. KBW10]|uniref:APC family permease n=1 Tax=Taibaiella sp. KBW10 TaxID=2153357 RepID=UPI000F5A68A3|nr:amino acid permease [Taibaiella sp. KBW10]RQO30793.1 amino acid transporter [Taibaiella sp. KBW10]